MTDLAQEKAFRLARSVIDRLENEYKEKGMKQGLRDFAKTVEKALDEDGAVFKGLGPPGPDYVSFKDRFDKIATEVRGLSTSTGYIQCNNENIGTKSARRQLLRSTRFGP